MADRPELEGDHAEQQRAEGDERRQPAFRVGHDQRDYHDGVGDEEEARQDGSDCRPAGQVRPARRCIVTGSRLAIAEPEIIPNYFV